MAPPKQPDSSQPADAIDPSRATAALERWRRAVAEVLGGDPGAPLDQPDRRLLMLRIFGGTRRLAELCLTHPDAAAQALMDGASPVLAEAARDLTALDRGVGGPDALYGALAPLKNRVDVAIAIAEMSGRWGVSDATAARVDFAERIVETGLRWLVRSAVKRGELTVEDPDNFLSGVFVIAGGDFAHEDLAPFGPIELVILYDEKAFSAPAAKGADRIFVRVGGELREALEGKPGDYPLYVMRTPLGSGVGGAGFADSVARVKATAAGPQADALRLWLGGSRVVAGDRTGGGEFLEEMEQIVWPDTPLSFEGIEADANADNPDPRAPFRRVAEICRLAIGGLRPVFRTASARQLFETAARSRILSADAARRLAAGEELAHIAVARSQMIKGAAGFAERKDEQAALARLCQYRDFTDLEAALTGARADAVNTLNQLLCAPQQEMTLYRCAAEDPDHDAENLENLGFINGLGISAAIDRWTGGQGGKGRFSEKAPGLLTAFGETQHPNDAIRLFDRLLSVSEDNDRVFARVREGAPARDAIADAFGSFGAAMGPLLETADKAAVFFEDLGAATPRTGEEWLTRHTPPPVDGKTALADFVAWRRDLIARIAFQAAAGGADIDCAVDALDQLHRCTLGNLFDIVRNTGPSAEQTAAGKIALHVYEGTGPHLPGAATHLGFIATGDTGEAGEHFARRYLQALSEIGEGVFAIAPDATHRPSGPAGPLVPTLAAFKAFVQSEAVAHEQIMLGRGRVVAAGTDKTGQGAVDALRSVVAGGRRADILFRDLDRARAQRVRRDRPASDWDFDRLEGGRADVELVISTLIFKHAPAHPIVQETSASEALEAMARSGLISEETAQSLAGARAFWSRLQLVRALSGWSDPLRAPVRRRFGALLARAAGVDKFEQVRPMMRGYREDVMRAYALAVLGRPALASAQSSG